MIRENLSWMIWGCPPLQPEVIMVPKKSIIIRIKDEVMHYVNGFRLFGIELKIATRHLWALLNGGSLTRREYRQVRQAK